MKKVLTVLAILVVLTSAIFAAETHKIKITATVAPSAPIFALEYDEDVTTENKTADSNGVRDGGTVATGVKINETKVSVDVLAKLLNSVKLANTTVYSLGFKAEPLTSVGTHKVGNAETPSQYAIKASATASSVAEASGTKAGITIGSAPTLAYDADDALTGTITATMDTSNIVAANLATFHVEYPATAEAPVDTYEAYITLTITT